MQQGTGPGFGHFSTVFPPSKAAYPKASGWEPPWIVQSIPAMDVDLLDHWPSQVYAVDWHQARKYAGVSKGLLSTKSW